MALEGDLSFSCPFQARIPPYPQGRDSWKDQITLLTLEGEYDWRVPAYKTPGDVLSPS